MEQNILKSLALMQHKNEEYFILDDVAYVGKLESAKKEYEEYQETPDLDTTFEKWVSENFKEVEEYDEDDYNNDYLVLTDKESNKKCAEYIKDSLWAFNASFIIEHSKLPYEALKMVKSFQEQKGEDANDTIEALIEDMDEFIEDAISADGRGHFNSPYNSNEYEETVENETFYIYRQN